MSMKEETYIALNGGLISEIVNKGYISGDAIDGYKHRKNGTSADNLNGKNQKKYHYANLVAKLFKEYDIPLNLANLLKIKFDSGQDIFEYCGNSKKENQSILEELLKEKILSTFNIAKSKKALIDFKRVFGDINLDTLDQAINERPDLLKDLVEYSELSPSSKAKALLALGQTDDSSYWEYVIDKRLSGNDKYLRQASYMIISEIYDRDKSYFPENILELLKGELAEASEETLIKTITDTVYNFKYAD